MELVPTRSWAERTARKAYRTVRPYRPERDPGYIVTQPNPSSPDLLPTVRLFAVLGTFMEEDIVESTVRNAFVQGVEKVFLVDNASTDATVARALDAGATLAESFCTETHQEEVRNLFMNAVVARESMAAGDDHIWWLWLDADEFPEGPDGLTIAEYLATLDRRFRLVGSTYYNHFPTTKPENIPGVHPVDLQPMCERYVLSENVRCSQPHWKHPLQRYDRHAVFLRAQYGFHGASVRTKERLFEPEGGIVTHHVQYREEAATRARLGLVAGTGRFSTNQALGIMAMSRRHASIDAVYAQQWDQVDNRGNRKVPLGVTLERWTGQGPRWYETPPLVASRDTN